MEVQFTPLLRSQFHLILKWLEKIDCYLDCEINKDWNETKLKNYFEDLKSRQSDTFVICCEKNTVGYLEFRDYKKYPHKDFSPQKLPSSLALLNFFIAEKIPSSQILEIFKIFLKDHVFQNFSYVATVIRDRNSILLKELREIGFVKIEEKNNKFLMIKSNKLVRLSTQDTIQLELSFKKTWLENDSLWVFGSRSNAKKSGGDLDLYIETYENDLDNVFNMKKKFILDLNDKLGEQKIDLILNIKNSSHIQPIFEIARNEGIKIA